MWEGSRKREGRGTTKERQYMCSGLRYSGHRVDISSKLFFQSSSQFIGKEVESQKLVLETMKYRTTAPERTKNNLMDNSDKYVNERH
jgi:hypothetical protein